MLRRFLLGIGIMVLLTLVGSTGFAETFTNANFEGTWNLYALGSGNNLGGWACGTFTSDATGSFKGSYFTSRGHSESSTLTLNINSNGIISALEDIVVTTPTFHGVMSNNKDVIVCTGTGGDDSYQLRVLLKNDSIFSTSDLQGTWCYHGLISGDQPNQLPGWYYGSITIDRNGNAIFSHVTDSEGNKDYIPPPDKFSITEDGLITMPQAVPIYGAMNQGKDVIVFVATMAPGSIHGVRGYNLMVALKSAGTFTTSDLAGTWYWHGLASGDETAWKGWFYCTTTVDNNGSFSFLQGSFLNSSGETDITHGGTMSITSDGIVTIPGKPDAHGRMNIDKDMIVMTMNDGGGGYDLIILVKADAIGGLDIDSDVDFVDFAILASQWMNQNCTEPNWCDGADLGKNGSVDMLDLSEFAEKWLAETTPLVREIVEGFETGDLSKLDWKLYGDANWTITSSQKCSGTYSAQAGIIEDYESTILSVTFDCAFGDITFYRKVSSESGFDYLRFYIDGVEQDGWSGEQDWARVSFPIESGIQTFKWTYSKDSSVSRGSDTAWIDDIIFPVPP